MTENRKDFEGDEITVEEGNGSTWEDRNMARIFITGFFVFTFFLLLIAPFREMYSSKELDLILNECGPKKFEIEDYLIDPGKGNFSISAVSLSPFILEVQGDYWQEFTSYTSKVAENGSYEVANIPESLEGINTVRLKESAENSDVKVKVWVTGDSKFIVWISNVDFKKLFLVINAILIILSAVILQPEE
ncbi:MAG TPA: hypothetical protein PLG47_02200 [Candidatus Dojkabacteria bacterium]|nr:hypothetical protein [Candidatus Dojkabacteria bacterium]